MLRRSEPKCSTVGHGISGVDGQVHQPALETCEVTDRRGGGLAKIAFDANRGSQDGVEHVDQALKALVNIDGSRLRALDVAEVKKLTGERSSPLGGGVDPTEEFGPGVGLGERFDFSPQPVTRAEDRLEQIVEVVSDSPRESANRIHFYGLAQLLGEFALARDIARETVVRSGLPVRDGNQEDVCVEG